MIEVRGDLWTYPADARVITTNGTIKKNGEAVMGAGCALEAKRRWPELPKVLGNLLKKGNNPYNLSGHVDINLWTFPVKWHWNQKADLSLIDHSAKELATKLDPIYPNDRGHVIVIPRPGCGNGGLKWDDVREVIGPIFDDRFHIITF